MDKKGKSKKKKSTKKSKSSKTSGSPQAQAQTQTPAADASQTFLAVKELFKPHVESFNYFVEKGAFPAEKDRARESEESESERRER